MLFQVMFIHWNAQTPLLDNLLSQVIVIAQVEIHYIAKTALIPIIVEAQVRLHQF